jgi:hypothetical protein
MRGTSIVRLIHATTAIETVIKAILASSSRQSSLVFFEIAAQSTVISAMSMNLVKRLSRLSVRIRNLSPNNVFEAFLRFQFILHRLIGAGLNCPDTS